MRPFTIFFALSLRSFYAVTHNEAGYLQVPYGLNGHGHLFFTETLKSALDFTLRVCPGSDQPRVDSGCHATQLRSDESCFICPLRGPRTSTTHATVKEGLRLRAHSDPSPGSAGTVVWSPNKVLFEP